MLLSRGSVHSAARALDDETARARRSQQTSIALPNTNKSGAARPRPDPLGRDYQSGDLLVGI